MDMRYPWIEQAIKTLNQAVELDFELVRTRHCAVNGRVERRSITSGSEDPDSHGMA